MKRILTVAAFAAVIMAGMPGTVKARSWRVNNNAAKAPNFADINAAVASDQVQNGDTLYLDPDCTLTTQQNVTKQLTIIGTGYFLTDLPFSAANIQGPLTIKAQNSKVEGMKLASVSIYADNVTVERCQTGNIFCGGNNTSVSSKNATIRQCYVNGYINGKGETDSGSANCIVENCIVIADQSNDQRVIGNLYMATIRNNYLKRTKNYDNSTQDGIFRNCHSCTITNNIMLNTSKPNQVLYSIDGSAVSNNVMSSTAYSSLPQNKYLEGASEAGIFALTGNNDERYQLKEDSPAKNYATDGGDCGPFGGLFPYVLSGHPVGMPYFVSTNVPTRSTNGQVKITQHVKLQTK